jgi:hypothetical protein
MHSQPLLWSRSSTSFIEDSRERSPRVRSLRFLPSVPPVAGSNPYLRVACRGATEIAGGVGVQWELPGAISPRRCGPVLRFLRCPPARLAFCPDGGIYAFLPVRSTRLFRRSRQRLFGPSGRASPFPSHHGKTGGPRPQEDAELMPQGEVLGRLLCPRTKEGHEGAQKDPNQAEHAERIRAEKESEGTARRPQEPQSPEAAMPPFGDLMGFWRGTTAPFH